MPDTRVSEISRRGVLAQGGAAVLGALLSACGGGRGGEPAADSASGGGWSFTDDRGRKVGLGARPRRIVAYVGAAAALHDFGVGEQIVGVFGPTKRKNGTRDPQAGALDVDRVTIIGNAYGEFDIEKYVGLRPDVLIGNMFVENDLFYVPQESKDKIFAIAPSLAIATGAVPLPRPIGRFERLAAALGADLAAAPVAAAKTRFEAAAAAVRNAAKARGGLKIMAASATPDLFYVSNPGKNSDLMYFRELGVDLVVPAKVDQQGYFESLSWENIDKYGADVIMLDSRTQALQPTDLAAGKPSWRRLPAVEAKQVIAWQPEPRFSYAGCAPILEALATTIRSARKAAV
jgi:iron complex transport system substrate-binding protein